jgi:galactose-1-phosphate uridylyltransferase
MSELRQDRTTGGWVIVAPQRGRRPQMRAPSERLPQRPRQLSASTPSSV